MRQILRWAGTRKELIVYYVGSAVAAIAPFFIDSTEGKVAEIVGLSVLTVSGVAQASV